MLRKVYTHSIKVAKEILMPDVFYAFNQVAIKKSLRLHNLVVVHIFLNNKTSQKQKEKEDLIGTLRLIKTKYPGVKIKVSRSKK